MARRGKLLPQLLAAIAAASHLLAVSVAPPSPDTVSVAVPPGAAPGAAVFRGARRLGQHHVFSNSTGDADARRPFFAEAPTSSFGSGDGVDPSRALSPLPTEEADADADVEDPASIAASRGGQDRPSPFPHPSKGEVITIVCFAALLAAVVLVLLVCGVIQKARDGAARRARVHPLDEDAAGGP